MIYQHNLESHYVRQIIIWLIAVIILLPLTGGVAAILMMLTMKLITAPALIFKEWISENPVSITSYTNGIVYLIGEVEDKVFDITAALMAHLHIGEGAT